MTPTRDEKAMTAELNLELYFVIEVLKLRSLHYGFWDTGTHTGEFDIEEIRSAQARFTRELLSSVPKEVETILDVGAGIGDNARALAEAGHRVTSISPDANHAKYFAELENPNVAFHRSKFEDFTSDEPFDLLLFSESHRYFDRDVGLRQCRQLVRPGGHILVSGMFRNVDNKKFPKNFDLLQLEYIQAAAEYGFVPVQLVDITRNVIPTMKIMHRALEEHVDPVLELVDTYMRARAPIKARLLKLLLRSQFRYTERVFEKYKKRTRPHRFRHWYRYLTILFKDDRAL